MRDKTLAELAALARLLVRAGYRDPEQQLAELTEFVAAEVNDPTAAADLSRRLLTEAAEGLGREERGWPARTDNDNLTEALVELRQAGFVVVEHCRDHFDARAALADSPSATGVVFFTETDVWHAVSDSMLELKAWHADTSAMLAADPELQAILQTLHRHGLAAVFDEGRIEVTLRWRRRPEQLRRPG